MGNRIFSGIFRRLHLRETWVVFFMLGIIMMNFPFIHIFFSSRRIFGIPILFHYLTWGWLMSIGVIYLFVKAIRLPEQEKKRGKDAEH